MQAPKVWGEGNKQGGNCDGIKTAALEKKTSVIWKPEQEALHTAGWYFLVGTM